MRAFFPLLACSLLIVGVLPAAQLIEPPEEEKGTYMGVLFSPIPQALRDHLPALPRSGGVMITHVLPRSPGEKGGLKRHDLLLHYDKVEIRGASHFAELIHNDKPKDTVTLSILRGGKATNIRVTLELGPVLRVAKSEVREGGDPSQPRGIGKPGSPKKVNVTAEPMDGNQMKVTFEFYHKGTGRLRKVTCSGTPPMIDKQVSDRLPESLQDVAKIAINRLRALNFQKPTDGSE